MSPIRWTVFVTVPLVTLRAALGCSDDNVEGRVVSTSPDGGAADDVASVTPPVDPPGPGEDAASVPPSFCAGLVLYASFDGVFETQVGATGGDASVYGSAALADAGRYGGSLALPQGTAGSWMFFSEQPGGFEFPEVEGSFAMWARIPIHAPQPNGTYMRAVADVDASTGLSLPVGLELAHSSPTRFGLKSNGFGGTLLDFPWAGVKPHLRPDAFNHIALAWNATDAGGPTAFFAINGGTGERYDDAGADAGVYVDDAGNRAYRAVVSKVWGNQRSPTAVRLGGSVAPTTPKADIDDFAIWNRVLSFEEMDALHRSPVSLAAACKLGL